MDRKRMQVFIPEGAEVEIHFQVGEVEREESLIIHNGDTSDRIAIAIQPFNKNAIFDTRNGRIWIEPI
jgi:hypothetical protein